MTSNTLRIATRESPLALWQANHVAAAIKNKFPHLLIEIIGYTTTGDRNLETTLSKIGGKGLFVKELELALLNNSADLAVHSLKDMPMELLPGLQIAAVCEREDPRDAFVSNSYQTFKDLPAGAIVGTSSLRRQSQLAALRPDLHYKYLRGNINTRVKRLDEGSFDAIILAVAGLTRLGFSQRIQQIFEPDQCLPSVAQGALAIECRKNDENVLSHVKFLNHIPTEICVTAERAMSRFLGASCQVPLAGYATLQNELLTLQGCVGKPDGTQLIKVYLQEHAEHPEQLGSAAAKGLLDQGAGIILDELKLT